MKLVAIANQKGGAGKTTTCMSLAAVAAESSRTLVVDVDPQRSSTWWADRSGDNLPFDIAADTDPAHLARLRELDYDTVFVDTPGSLEGQAVMRTVFAEADFIILPTEPQALAFQPLTETIKTLVLPSGKDYRVLLNKIDPRSPRQLEDAQALVDGAGFKRFKNAVRIYQAHAEAPLRGEVVTQYPLTRSTMKAIEDYRRVALELFAVWTNSPQTPVEVA